MPQTSKLIVSLLTAGLLALPVLAQQNIITTAIGGGPNDMPALDADLGGPAAVAVDSAGNYYVADYRNNRVFKVDTTGFLTVVAGTGVPGYSGDGVSGGAPNATLYGPSGVAVDSSGNIYIADTYNSVIRKVDTTNTITTIAGQGSVGCNYNGNGSPATNYGLCYPAQVSVDTSGNLYIADTENCLVREVVPSTSTISNVAGNGTCGYSGDGGSATNAEMYLPNSVAVDSSGNLYIADTDNFRIREVVHSTGRIKTIAGNGTNSFAGDGGPATSAEVDFVYGIAVNSTGTTVTITDSPNGNAYYGRVRQFTVGGNINTIAGGNSPYYCGDGGPATSACLADPGGVAVTSSGSVYVADYDNGRVRQFTVGGNINTVAGDGGSMPVVVSGIPPSGVVLNYPWGVVSDPSGDTFVSDQYNYMVRELSEPANVVNFFAGDGTYGYTGDNGPATSAELGYTGGVARDSAGNVYIADTYNCAIREVSLSGTITTFAGGSCGYSGDGGPAASAKLYYPQGVAVDSHDNVYIADSSNNVIRKVTGGIITTIAGNGLSGYFGDGGPATAARLYSPYAVSVDGAGNIYIADTYNQRLRAVSASTGIITTVAGNGYAGFDGDGIATQQSLYYPSDVKADSNGNLFIADTNNSRVRWVDPSGIMTTFAGTGAAGNNGDGGSATSANLYDPAGIFEDAAGNFLVSDQYNYRVRGITAFAGLGVSTRNLSFGIVAIGSTTTPQNVTLSGVGPLTIESISASTAFTETDDCGSALPNGETCTIQVSFKPTASGAKTGTLIIVTNGYFAYSTTINLVGEGSAISIKGNPTAFGNQPVKTTSAAKSVTISNKGKTGVTMGAITLSDTADFAIASNTCPASGSALAAKATCTIQLTFTPQSTGTIKATLLINDNDPTSPQYVDLTGTGTSNVVLSPGSIQFAVTPIGVASAASTVTLTNNTGVLLTLGTPAVSFTGPFSSTTATCTNGLAVPPAGTCTISVIYTPTSGGPQTGVMRVSDSDATSPQTVALSGIGTGIKFSPASLNLGRTGVGNELTGSVTLTNVGATAITFTNASMTGANAADFSTSLGNPPCSGTLAAGASCPFTVYFIPSKVGKESATYQVYDNSPGSPQTLALSGTGQ